ncbi:MAG: aminopeptidase P family protein [Bacteroidetes bacterium]|nr:MAG: aminopeptidase P family protein [Bacteroidota bacterium]
MEDICRLPSRMILVLRGNNLKLLIMENSRDKSLRDLIVVNNLGGLLFWRTEEHVLSTGYLPLWGVSVCRYPASGKPILYIPELEPRDRLPEGVEIKTFPWGIIDCADPWEVLFNTIKEDIFKRGIDHLPLGYVPHFGQTAPPLMSGEGAPLPLDFLKRIQAIPVKGLRDVTGPMLELYMVKQPHEIEAIALSNKIAGIGIKAFYHHLEPGISEAEVASVVEAAVQNQMGKNGVEYAKAWPLIMSGPNTAYGGTFNRTTGKKLVSGELVMIEMAICVNGYWADITRTGTTGNVQPELLAIYEIVKEAQQMAIAAVKPEITGGELDQIARNYIDKKGYGDYYNHALGHHVGFRYHDPGPGLSPQSDLRLKEGMVLTIEPGIYGEELGGGCRIEDNVLVTASGHEILSDFSRALNPLSRDSF